MGLDVCMVSIEKFFRPPDSKPFYDISIFAAAVIPPVGIPLGILVGENRPLRFLHSTACIVFGSDQEYFALFPFSFFRNRVKKLGINIFKLLAIHCRFPNLILGKFRFSWNPLSLCF